MYQVEAVNVGLFDPSLELICYKLGRTDNGGAQSAHGDVLGNGDLGPFGYTGR